MKFLQPLGLILGLLLPIIILLYLKKKQVVEQKISNLDLWDEVLKEVEGLKRNKIDPYILLIIQLLIGLLIVFVFAKPVYMKGFKGEEITIGIDASIMMKAEEDGKTHFESAKIATLKYIENVDENSRYNLVLMKNNSEVLLKKSTKKEIQKAIESIYCTNEPLNVPYASNILNSITGKSIIVTNKNLSLGDRTIKIGNEFENMGIVDVNYDYYENTALCRIKNYGKKNQNVMVLMVDDQGKKDLQSIKVMPSEEKDISFSVVNNPQKLIFTIKHKDMFTNDNDYMYTLGNENKKKVLYIGENDFFKKALLSIKTINVEFTDKFNEKQKNYDLYIVDEEMDTKILPQKSSIWELKNNHIAGKVKGALKLEAVDSEISKNLNMNEIYIEDIGFLKKQKNDFVVLEANEKPVMMYRKEGEQKRIYSTIDFYKTNLVMTPDFPILISNTIEWFLEGKQINIETNPPSKLVIGENYEKEEKSIKKITNAIVDLKSMFLIIVLLLMVLEWEVYKRAT